MKTAEIVFFFFMHKTAYEMRIIDWSSDVCSSDLTNQLPIPASGASTRRLGISWPPRTQESATSRGVWSCIATSSIGPGPATVAPGCCKIGRQSCTERVSPDEYVSVVAVSGKNTTIHENFPLHLPLTEEQPR